MKNKLFGVKDPKNRKKKQNKLFGNLSTVKSAAKVVAATAIQSKAGNLAVDMALSSVPIVPSSVKRIIANKAIDVALDAAGIDSEINKGNSNSSAGLNTINQAIKQQQAQVQKLKEEVKVIKNALIKLIKRVDRIDE